MLVVDRVDKPAPNAPGVAQKLPPRPLKFEVADLKLNKTGGQSYLGATRGGLQGTNLSLLAMLGFAWDMESARTTARFIGLPKGLESVYFDVNAITERRTNGPPPEFLSGYDDDVRGMLRTLLTERFRIQWHYENRPMEAYSLVSAKPKLKKATRPTAPLATKPAPIRFSSSIRSKTPPASPARGISISASAPCRCSTQPGRRAGRRTEWRCFAGRSHRQAARPQARKAQTHAPCDRGRSHGTDAD